LTSKELIIDYHTWFFDRFMECAPVSVLSGTAVLIVIGRTSLYHIEWTTKLINMVLTS